MCFNCLLFYFPNVIIFVGSGDFVKNNISLHCAVFIRSSSPLLYSVCSTLPSPVVFSCNVLVDFKHLPNLTKESQNLSVISAKKHKIANANSV